MWIGAALTVGGLYLLCGSYGSLGLGDLLLFIGTAFWTAHIITLDRAGHGVRAIRFSCIQFSVCAILGFICAFIFEEVRLDAIRAAAVPILYGGVMSSGVAYTCQLLGQRDADPTAASIVLSTESVWAAIGGALILHENMTPPAIGGCVLIFCGDRAFADRDRTKEEPGRRLTKRRTKDEIRKKDIEKASRGKTEKSAAGGSFCLHG